MRSIFIQKNPILYEKIKWTVSLIKHNHGANFVLVDDEASADITIGFEKTHSVCLSKKFYDQLENKTYAHEKVMPNGPFILNEDQEIDYLSSIFYLVNGIQEYGCKELDQYGRFSYHQSLQKRWNSILENTVYEYIIEFCTKNSIVIDVSPVKQLILSHDIDFLHSAWKSEGKWALKNIKINKLFRLLQHQFRGNQLYQNIDEIIAREQRLGFSSTFFWIVKCGRDNDGIINGDYDVNSDVVTEYIKKSSKQGFDHGIHKSTLKYTLSDEIKTLSFNPIANRYHFLKYTLPEAFDEVERSGLSIDSSLAFIQHYGFRNSYGLPFVPFNLKENRPYNFLEVPINLIDGSFYEEYEQEEVFELSTSFIEKHKSGALISVLYHNSELTDFKYEQMNKTYDRLLEYLSVNGMKNTKMETLYTRYFNGASYIET